MSWGAVPELFDEARAQWAPERAQLRSLLDDRAYAAARRTTINAPYTDPAYVETIWTALKDLGFDAGLSRAPARARSSAWCPTAPRWSASSLTRRPRPSPRRCTPDATIRTESFADTPYRAGHFDATVGKVPFADVRLHDPRHNCGGHSLHNHCIIKSLALTRPGRHRRGAHEPLHPGCAEPRRAPRDQRDGRPARRRQVANRRAPARRRGTHRHACDRRRLGIYFRARR
jgi:hypothetical protein